MTQTKKTKKRSELRTASIKTGIMPNAEGSAEIRIGNTRIICTASVEEGVPPFLRDKGQGWVTAEYSMLPRSTSTRKRRDRKSGVDGRAMEIQRLIGRSLRAAVDMKKLGERTIIIDCDVIQADGGTRTASITGAFVALAKAIEWLMNKKLITKNPIDHQVAAISAGIIKGRVHLDLCYEEDSTADVDLNVVMTDDNKFIEIQGTAEREAFDSAQLSQMLKLASQGIKKLFRLQKETLRRKK